MNDRDDDQRHDVSPLFAIPHVYINSVKVASNPYEFQLIFGRSVLDNLTGGDQIHIQPHFVAQTSPEHFKVMVQVFKDQLDKYESAYGVIPEDKDRGKQKE